MKTKTKKICELSCDASVDCKMKLILHHKTLKDFVTEAVDSRSVVDHDDVRFCNL